jgi:protein phosphatase
MALVRGGAISREEAHDHPDKNVISRALGSHRDVEVTTWPRPFVVRPGDRFLLCSDGLHDVISEESVREAGLLIPPHEACRELVARTRAAGAPDNVSVILLVVPGSTGDPAVRTTRALDLPA